MTPDGADQGRDTDPGPEPEPGDMPPRSRLARRLLPRDLRDEVFDDLDERYRTRRTATGRRRARWWYRRQAAGLALWGLQQRMSEMIGGVDVTGGLVDRGFATDVRLAVRALRRNPLYASVAIVTLALGIGGNTAVFSVVDGVLIRPLPFPEPTELVAIHETRVGQSWWSAAPSNALAWRERSRTLDDVAWGQARRASLLSESGEPESVLAVAASANLFGLLEVPAHLGRTFEPGDDVVAAPPVALLTYDSWIGRFGGSRDVLGSRLVIDGVPHTLVGVLPAGREPTFFGAHEVVVPRPLLEQEIQIRGRILQSVGRIADGVSLSAARAEMAALGATLDAEAPGGDARGWGVRLVPLKDQMVGDTRNVLLVLLGAVGLVLLVACANVSNLLLARGNARAAELALRASLGAGRGRLLRLMLAEAALIAGVGGALGLALAAWGTNALLALDPGALPRLDAVTPDLRVMAFATAVSVATVALFGLAPALRATRLDLAGAFRSSGPRGGAGRSDARMRSALVATEVALVVMLMIGAGVMLQGVRALSGVDPGFEVENRLAVRLTIPASRYPDSASIAGIVRELATQAAALPEVVAAGTVSTLPLSGGPGYTSFHVPRSQPTPEPGGEPIGGMEIVTPGYFEAMGIPLREGRTYTAADLDEGRPIVVADDGLAEAFWQEQDALSDALRIAPPSAGAAAAWREVIGVVGSVRYGLDVEPRPRIYLLDGHVGFNLRPRTLVAKIRPGAEDAAIPALREAVRRADPLLPIERVEWLDDVSHTSISRARLQGVLLTIFAMVALGLGAVGVYGVVSYAVARRTREVGVRLALGASRPSVVAEVVRGALLPVVGGLVLGVVGAALLSGIMASLVTGVDRFDVVTFTSAPALLLAIATAAAFAPGVRASRVDPVEALRQE